MKPSDLGHAALGIGVVIALASCGGSQPPIGTPGAIAQALTITTPAWGGRSWSASDIMKIKADLLVDDIGGNDVDVLKNGTWKYLGNITKGVTHPNANWVDRRGNLYVTNRPGSVAYISEYNRSGSLKFTYSSGMQYPLAVTTDAKGNVYEADLFNGIDEYPQGKDVVFATCPDLAEGDRGVAVDSHGDVFVSYSTGDSTGAIAEYPGGLAGCHTTTLAPALGVPNGIALDKNANLLVCDGTYQSVDVIDPPYSQISGYLGSGYLGPVDVSIKKDNSQVYVSDYAAGEVDVFTYPAGSKIATLNYTDGVEYPMGAVDGSNYVP